MGKLLLPMLLAAAVVFAAQAAEEKAPKEEAKKDAPAPAGKEETLKGLLGTNSEGRTTLKVKGEEKTSPVKTYILWPDADTAKTLAELVKKKADAEVTGLIAPDGVNVKVSRVSEAEKKKKK